MNRIKENYKLLLFMLAFITLVGSYTGFVYYQKIKTDNPAANTLLGSEGKGVYTDLRGEVIDLSDYLGGVLIVNSWASWSPASASELSLLSSLTSLYGEGSVKILAINRAEPQVTAERFLRTITSEPSVRLVLDPEDRFYKSIGGYAMPETVIYNKDGSVHSHFHGPVSEETMKSAISEVLDNEDNK